MFVVFYNVAGCQYKLHNDHLYPVGKKYYFDNLDVAIRNYNRLCKYRPHL